MVDHLRVNLGTFLAAVSSAHPSFFRGAYALGEPLLLSNQGTLQEPVACWVEGKPAIYRVAFPQSVAYQQSLRQGAA